MPLLKSSEVIEPEVIFPQECYKPAPPSPPYASDLIMRPMGDIAGLKIVPGVNEWGILMANSTLNVNGKVLTFDDILYGYEAWQSQVLDEKEEQR